MFYFFVAAGTVYSDDKTFFIIIFSLYTWHIYHFKFDLFITIFLFLYLYFFVMFFFFFLDIFTEKQNIIFSFFIFGIFIILQLAYLYNSYYFVFYNCPGSPPILVFVLRKGYLVLFLLFWRVKKHICFFFCFKKMFLKIFYFLDYFNVVILA